MERTCIFGGTFNPVHRGHLAMAVAAREQFALDRILWVPAGLPPHKPRPDGATTGERLEMIRLAIAGQPGFALSQIDVDRPGPSYAIDTLHLLEKQYPATEWFWLIGQDMLTDLESWVRASELIPLCHWIIALRSRGPMTTLNSTLERLRQCFGDHFHLLNDFECEVSSTEVRGRLGRGEIGEEVPAAVQAFIREHRLYGLDASPPAPLH